MSFLSGILGKIGGLFGRAMSSAPKLGSIQSGVQKLGSVANIVQKLGIGGNVGKVAGAISKLPLEELGKTAQSAFDVGKQIFETGKKVASALKPQPVPAEQGAGVRPVAVGGAGQPVMNPEDL